MKRFLVSILAILYLCTASGATVTLHYCMGKLVSASLAHDEGDDHECSECGMTKKKSAGCCKDEHKVMKTDPAQHASKADLSFTPALCPPKVSFPLPQPSEFSEYHGTIHLCCHAPPSAWRTCPIYVEIRNFRI